ncbi:uncharacterized protein LOC116222354 [Clupea harengus]|uniref:Uncharacterized protein LOC116222354 n=1 Tax=Clupea harengus TaxID=7950 RepID=A0A8M1KMJ2_CLUHA|nr:uncharacterized protein LOC116222354 [Clupea harengus]
MVIKVIFVVMCLLVSQGSVRVTLSTSCCNTDNCNTGSPPGFSKDTLSTSCCNTDNCNTGSPPGISKYTLSTSCCNTDNCNTGSPPDECNTGSPPVNLAGLSTSVKGCATQSVCSGAFSQELDSVATELTCCEGDLCNAKEDYFLFFLWFLSVHQLDYGFVFSSGLHHFCCCLFAGRSIAEVNVKSCTPSGECLNGSLNTGTLRRTLSTSCCDTDNCNTERPSGNCFVLMESHDESNVQGGVISVAGPNATIKGCATQSVCSGAFSDELDLLAVELTCCEGDLCNSACSATHSVLFLLWPLGSVLLFH